jgi:hypothetical protein
MKGKAIRNSQRSLEKLGPKIPLRSNLSEVIACGESLGLILSFPKLCDRLLEVSSSGRTAPRPEA